MEPCGFGDRRLRVVREVGIDLDGHVSVPATPFVPDGAQKVKRLTHVARGELDEHLLEIALVLQDRAQLLVVGVSRGDRLLEDGRVRRHADDGVLAHHARQLPPLQEVAGEKVDPDALS